MEKFCQYITIHQPQIYKNVFHYASNENKCKKEKPCQDPILTRFSETTSKISFPTYFNEIISHMTSNVNCFWQI